MNHRLLLHERRVGGRKCWSDIIWVNVVGTNNPERFALPASSKGRSVDRIVEHLLDLYPEFARDYVLLDDSQKCQAISLKIRGVDHIILSRNGKIPRGSEVVATIFSNYNWDEKHKCWYHRLSREGQESRCTSFSDPTCSICIQEIIATSVRRELACGHVFHLECIESWFAVKTTCPLCRKEDL